ncbi:MAG TPA: hypothetical protein VJ785_17295 [Anaerolineales bacterium]|nr:hypothetical protein [Anaerolineales bacterium]
MNIRCSFCQTPYTLSRVAMLDALQEVDSKKLTHYDAHCPRCRRATPIPRQRLEMAMPNWRDELKQFEKEMKQHPQQEAPLPKPESTPVAEAAAAPEPVAETPAKKGATKAKPTATPAESKRETAARQTTPSAETKKSIARKTATKGTSKKSK